MQHITPPCYFGGWLVVLLFGVLAAGTMVGMIELHSFSQVATYVWLLAAVVLNFILLFGRVIVRHLWKTEQHWVYSHHMANLIYK